MGDGGLSTDISTDNTRKPDLDVDESYQYVGVLDSMMATSVSYTGVDAIFGFGNDRSYHYRKEEKENDADEITAKKALPGDFSLVEKFEMGCVLSTGMDLEDIVAMTVFLSPR